MLGVKIRTGLYIHTAAAQAAVSFRNFRFSPKLAYAPTPYPETPHIIATAQIFFDQTSPGQNRSEFHQEHKCDYTKVKQAKMDASKLKKYPF